MTERLTTLVESMRQPVGAACPFLCAAFRVAQEYDSSPMMDAVKQQIDQMLMTCRLMCAEYDNLRAVVARWEYEQGAKEPVFWPGEINASGCPRNCRHAEMLAAQGAPALGELSGNPG